MSAGLSDFNRRLTVFGPAVADAGYYECEAVLRSSSVPSVSAGAYLHVHGRSAARPPSRSHPFVGRRCQRAPRSRAWRHR